MNDPELKRFIREKSDLFWYIPNDQKENINHDLIVETILNYGNMDDVKNLLKIMGIQEMAHIFFSARKRKKENYYPEIYNFFSLFFSRYA